MSGLDCIYGSKTAGKGPNILEITPEDLPAEAKCYFNRYPHPIPTLDKEAVHMKFLDLDYYVLRKYMSARV